MCWCLTGLCGVCSIAFALLKLGEELVRNVEDALGWGHTYWAFVVLLVALQRALFAKIVLALGDDGVRKRLAANVARKGKLLFFLLHLKVFARGYGVVVRVGLEESVNRAPFPP